MALYNATVREPDPAKCAALADRIQAIRQHHDSPEIALFEAQALVNARDSR